MQAFETKEMWDRNKKNKSKRIWSFNLILSIQSKISSRFRKEISCDWLAHAQEDWNRESAIFKKIYLYFPILHIYIFSCKITYLYLANNWVNKHVNINILPRPFEVVTFPLGNLWRLRPYSLPSSANMKPENIRLIANMFFITVTKHWQHDEPLECKSSWYD